MEWVNGNGRGDPDATPNETEALAEPMRLHEVVAKTGCSMSEVFDLVNAYDAIGALSWEQRASLRG